MSLRKYPAYKDSGVAWLGKVPSDWQVLPLKAVATCNDEVLSEGTDAGTLIEYVEISGVEEGRGITQTETLTFGSAPSRARRVVRHGDVLISTVRTYLRAIATVTDPPENLIASTGFAAIRARTAHPGFLGYLLHSEYLMSEVIARSSGISYPAINASDLMRLKGPIPSLGEQQAIAAFLDRETSKIGALIEEQKHLIDLLKEKRQSVISLTVTRGLDPCAPLKDSGVEWLGQVPAHWQTSRLANLFSDTDERGSEELPVLTVSIHDGVSDDELDEAEMDRKVTRSDDKTKYKRVQPGDLVYNMMRAWQGGFGSVTVDGMVSPAYVVARPKTSFSTEFVEHLLRTPNAIEEMRGRSRGVTDFRLRLYWEEFKEIVIPLPPKHEVEAILEQLRELTARTVDTISAADECIEILQERRSALISAAVTGKIDVRGTVGQTELAAA